MAETVFLAPGSIQEAVLFLLKHGAKSRIIAGGTDVLVPPEDRPALPAYLISLRGIRDLESIRYDERDGLHIGALATIGSLEKSSLVQEKYGILAQAAGTLGTPAVRNQATIGGNLCNAAPSADMAPPLIALGARVKINSVDKEWLVPLEDFFVGPGRTVLKAGQMLTEVQIPIPSLPGAGAYLKHTRNRGADLALVGVAAQISLKNGILKNVKIALGAVAPTPIRAKKAESVLTGKKQDANILREAASVASGETSCIDDVRCSADYRRKLVSVLVSRAITEAVAKVDFGDK
jgi:CO/xanthine dehydrogenase FAD-binding subunit